MAVAGAGGNYRDRDRHRDHALGRPERRRLKEVSTVDSGINGDGRDDTPSGVLIWFAVLALMVIIVTGWAVFVKLVGS
jgi:cytochrome b subunit of formate dehydrogenase